MIGTGDCTKWHGKPRQPSAWPGEGPCNGVFILQEYLHHGRPVWLKQFDREGAIEKVFVQAGGNPQHLDSIASLFQSSLFVLPAVVRLLWDWIRSRLKATEIVERRKDIRRSPEKRVTEWLCSSFNEYRFAGQGAGYGGWWLVPELESPYYYWKIKQTSTSALPPKSRGRAAAVGQGNRRSDFQSIRTLCLTQSSAILPL